MHIEEIAYQWIETPIESHNYAYLPIPDRGKHGSMGVGVVGARYGGKIIG